MAQGASLYNHNTTVTARRLRDEAVQTWCWGNWINRGSPGIARWIASPKAARDDDMEEQLQHHRHCEEALRRSSPVMVLGALDTGMVLQYSSIHATAVRTKPHSARWIASSIASRSAEDPPVMPKAARDDDIV